MITKGSVMKPPDRKSRQTVDNLVQRGDLAAPIKCGQSVFWLMRDVLAYIENIKATRARQAVSQ